MCGARACPLYPRKRTCAAHYAMSALGHNRTLIGGYSITSSARLCTDCGTVMPSALAVFKLMISSTFVVCWTGRSAGFSPLRIFPAGGDNHGDMTVNQIGRKCRQSIVLTFRPAIFDLHVLALDIACLFQSLPERAQTDRVSLRRCAAKETNHRLLRAPSNRPCSRGANNHFNELAPSHCLPRGSGQGIVVA